MMLSHIEIVEIMARAEFDAEWDGSRSDVLVGAEAKEDMWRIWRQKYRLRVVAALQALARAGLGVSAIDRVDAGGGNGEPVR